MLSTTLSTTLDDCTFKCRSNNDTSMNITNILNIDESDVNIHIITAAFAGFFGALFSAAFISENYKLMWVFIIFCIALLGFTIYYGSNIIKDDINALKIKGKIGKIVEDTDIPSIYHINAAFWGCESYLITFWFAILVLSLTHKNVIIIEGWFSYIFNLILIMIPVICWSRLASITKNIKCTSHPNPPNKGILPQCNIDETYGYTLQNMYGFLICGLLVILGIIGFSIFK